MQKTKWRTQQRRTARNGGPIDVIMLDVNNYKRFDDMLGHGASSTLYQAKHGGWDRVAVAPAI